VTVVDRQLSNISVTSIYYSKNKLHFGEMMFVLYKINTLCWIVIVLVHSETLF